MPVDDLVVTVSGCQWSESESAGGLRLMTGPGALRSAQREVKQPEAAPPGGSPPAAPGPRAFQLPVLASTRSAPSADLPPRRWPGAGPSPRGRPVDAPHTGTRARARAHKLERTHTHAHHTTITTHTQLSSSAAWLSCYCLPPQSQRTHDRTYCCCSRISGDTTGGCRRPCLALGL